MYSRKLRKSLQNGFFSASSSENWATKLLSVPGVSVFNILSNFIKNGELKAKFFISRLSRQLVKKLLSENTGRIIGKILRPRV